MVSRISVRNIQIGSRLRDVTASFESGRITAICGPNGAGKSTLLSVMAGLLMPDSGAVKLGERMLADIPQRECARRIGFLPQNGEIAWDVSLRTLVALGRMPHGDDAVEPVERAIAALELGDLADRPMSRISGGEKARALLARVMAGEPEWILADEPLAALDLGHQLTLLRHLRDAADKGAGIVIVLHDLALAMNHADRVVVLDDGALAADGTPQDALSADIIDRVWRVAAHWIGEPGGRALIAAQRV